MTEKGVLRNAKENEQSSHLLLKGEIKKKKKQMYQKWLTTIKLHCKAKKKERRKAEIVSKSIKVIFNNKNTKKKNKKRKENN